MIHDGDARAVSELGIGKPSAALELHAERLEPVSGDARPEQIWLLALVEGASFDDHTGAAAAPTERNRVRDRRRGDAWQTFDATENVLDRLLLGAAAVVSRAGEIEAHREDLFGIEADRDMLQSDEGPHEQRCTHEENERQRHFADDERAAQAIVSRSTARSARAFFEYLGELAARGLHRRRQPEERAGDDRHDCGVEKCRAVQRPVHVIRYRILGRDGEGNQA